MSNQTWNGKEKIGVINFPETFRRACNDGGIHEGAAMMLFQYYLRDSPWKTIKDRIEAPAETSEERKDQRKNKKLTSWSLVVQKLLTKFATDQYIAEANSRVSAWRIPEGMRERKYAEVLQDRARKCGDVYSDSALLEYFANGVSPAIQDQLREYMCDHRKKDLDAIDRHAQAIPRAEKDSKPTKEHKPKKDYPDKGGKPNGQSDNSGGKQ